MSREELVDAYVQGQISRRTFIRRLVGAGISIAAAVTYADVLAAPAASASSGDCDFYDEVVEVRASRYAPSDITIALGDTVRWQWVHNNREVRSTLGLFNSGELDNGAHFCVKFKWAGLHRYRNRIEDAYRGTVAVPPVVIPSTGLNAGDIVRIKWGTVNAPAGFGWDVDRRSPQDNAWVRIFNQVQDNEVVRTLNAVGLWRFRARLHRTNPYGVSGWTQTSVQVDP